MTREGPQRVRGDGHDDGRDRTATSPSRRATCTSASGTSRDWLYGTLPDLLRSPSSCPPTRPAYPARRGRSRPRPAGTGTRCSTCSTWPTARTSVDRAERSTPAGCTASGRAAECGHSAAAAAAVACARLAGARSLRPGHRMTARDRPRAIQATYAAHRASARAGVRSGSWNEDAPLDRLHEAGDDAAAERENREPRGRRGRRPGRTHRDRGKETRDDEEDERRQIAVPPAHVSAPTVNFEPTPPTSCGSARLMPMAVKRKGRGRSRRWRSWRCGVCRIELSPRDEDVVRVGGPIVARGGESRHPGG